MKNNTQKYVFSILLLFTYYSTYSQLLFTPNRLIGLSGDSSGVGIGTKYPTSTLDVRGSLFIGKEKYNGLTILSLPEINTGNEKPVSLVGVPQRGILVKDRLDMEGGLWLIGGSYYPKKSEYGAIGAGLISDGSTSYATGTGASYIQFYEGNIMFLGKKNLTKSAAFYADISMFIDGGSRNVGIGTSNPGIYKLAVEGMIGARRIKVTQSAWADFVFAPNYYLRTIKELEHFILSNKHLPNIPTEAQIKENGLDIGDMQKLQMQKIEELTLYVIKQQKEIDTLKNDINILKKKKK